MKPRVLKLVWPKDYGMFYDYDSGVYRCQHCSHKATKKEEHGCRGYSKPWMSIKLFKAMEFYGKYFNFLI